MVSSFQPCCHLPSPAVVLHPPAVVIPVQHLHCMEDTFILSLSHCFNHNRHCAMRYFTWRLQIHLPENIRNLCTLVWRMDGTQVISTNGCSPHRRTAVMTFSHRIQIVLSGVMYNACRHSPCLWLECLKQSPRMHTQSWRGQS